MQVAFFNAFYFRRIRDPDRICFTAALYSEKAAHFVFSDFVPALDSAAADRASVCLLGLSHSTYFDAFQVHEKRHELITRNPQLESLIVNHSPHAL